MKVKACSRQLPSPTGRAYRPALGNRDLQIKVISSDMEETTDASASWQRERQGLGSVIAKTPGYV